MGAVHGEPLALLRWWLPANDEPDRPRVQVATVDADGGPDLRTVLLSEWSADGFVFHTDGRSRKAQQLAADPAVAMLMLWPGFSRQLVVKGRAEPVDDDVLARGFAARSPYLRRLAWQNSEETAQLAPEDRAERWRRFAAEHDPAALAAPPSWAGFLLRPVRLTFWESDAAGPSHRLEFRRGPFEDRWTAHHLPG